MKQIPNTPNHFSQRIERRALIAFQRRKQAATFDQLMDRIHMTKKLSGAPVAGDAPIVLDRDRKL